MCYHCRPPPALLLPIDSLVWNARVLFRRKCVTAYASVNITMESIIVKVKDSDFRVQFTGIRLLVMGITVGVLGNRYCHEGW